jgi:hypothetical protein
LLGDCWAIKQFSELAALKPVGTQQVSATLAMHTTSPTQDGGATPESKTNKRAFWNRLHREDDRVTHLAFE